MKQFTALVYMAPPVATTYGSLVSMSARYDSTSDEHRKWAEATPAMAINMNVKADLHDEFEPGEYIVTFTKREDYDASQALSMKDAAEDEGDDL